MRSKTGDGSIVPAEHVGEQFRDVRAGRRDAAAQRDVAVEHVPRSTPAPPPCGTPTKPTAPPSRAMAIAVRIDCSVPTASITACAPWPPVSSRTAATASSPRSATTSVAPKRSADVGAGLVAAQRDDPLGAEALGGEHAAQADRAVADHGDGGARAHPGARARRGGRSTSRRTAPAARSSAVVAGPPGSSTRVPSAYGTRTASPWPPSEPGSPQKPPCGQEVCRPSRQKSQVPSDQTNGATTRSPG